MPQIWIIFTIISGLSSIIFNLMNRHTLRNGNDSTSYAWWFEFLRTLLFLPFCLVFLNFKLNVNNLLLFAAIGLAEFIGVYIYMKMHSFSELSTSSIISQLRVVWVPIIAFLFLGERLLSKEYFGIFLIFSGQILLLFKGKFTLDKGIKFSLISSVFVAVNSILQKIATPVFEIPIIVLAMGLPTVFGFPILMKDGKSRIKMIGSKMWKKVTIAVLFNAITMIFLLLAIKTGEVSKVTALFQSTAVLQVFSGIVFLKEKSNALRKVVGIFV